MSGYCSRRFVFDKFEVFVFKNMNGILQDEQVIKKSLKGNLRQTFKDFLETYKRNVILAYYIHVGQYLKKEHIKDTFPDVMTEINNMNSRNNNKTLIRDEIQKIYQAKLPKQPTRKQRDLGTPVPEVAKPAKPAGEYHGVPIRF